MSRTSRSTLRTAVVIMTLVVLGLVAAAVVWLRNFMAVPGTDVADTDGRLRTSLVEVDEETATRARRGSERRLLDVDRMLGVMQRGDGGADSSSAGEQGGNSDAARSGAAGQKASQEYSAALIAARKVANAFLQSDTVEERGRLIRNRETDLALMRDFYLRNPENFISGGSIGRVVTGPVDLPMMRFTVNLPDGSQKFIGLVEADGFFQVDWPSYVIHHEREWDEFVKQRVADPTTVRVYASPVNYYNYGFDDPETYYCMRLENGRDPYGHEPLYGYIRRDHEDFIELNQLAQIAGQQLMPLVLKIRYPDSSGAANQVEIVGLISNGWMIRD